MKPRSAKNKGKKLQNTVRDLLLNKFDHERYCGDTTCPLEQDDIKSVTMGESGVDIQLSPAARRVIPFDIECKCQEKLNIWGALSQAEDNSKAKRIPLVVFKRNRSDIYCSLKFEDLLKLM